MNDLDRSLSFLKSETGKALARGVQAIKWARTTYRKWPTFFIDEDRDVRRIDSKLANGMEWDSALMYAFVDNLCYALEFNYEAT